MFPVKTILHPTDLSQSADAAYQVACDLARQQKAELVALGNRSRVDIARNRGFGYCCGWHGCSTDSIGRSVGIAAA